ncbi:glycosyltransferase 87 family protein [Legionella tunisiensis]|uniref:glycosyltransferase 87 family protein n=1 Tax=Legionella tunisiensis TaxID=1034944 RepID=UPI001E3283DC|nr:glycosyltransferase 87 family protein [Legionella tunisiensis]
MNFHRWQIAVLLILLSTYSVLFYFIFTYQYKLDFSSFYSAFQLFSNKQNPYQILYTTYLPTVKRLSANLNPPIVLWMLTPLLRLSYDLALIIWSAISLLLGLIGAHFSFKLAFPPDFMKKNWVSLYLMYLSLFATVMDTAIAQFGSILFFFIITGYYCYLKNKENSAGILWGVIIAMKFFPALLFSLP